MQDDLEWLAVFAGINYQLLFNLSRHVSLLASHADESAELTHLLRQGNIEQYVSDYERVARAAVYCIDT